MNRTRLFLLLPLLAVAACASETKPLTGFDRQPPGSLLLDSSYMAGNGELNVSTLFTLSTPQQFRVLLNGQDAVTSSAGFYDYFTFSLQGWTGNISYTVAGIPPATYVVELVDSGGQSWGQSPPLSIPAFNGDVNPGDPMHQLPTVLFVNYNGHAGTWALDTAMQDADLATDEITVTNLISEDVIVERCLIASGSRTSCTPVGTVAPGADLSTVETLMSFPTGTSFTGDHQALFVHPASDANQSYQRDLVQMSADIGACEMEHIFFLGARPLFDDVPGSPTVFATSSCPYASRP